MPYYHIYIVYRGKDNKKRKFLVRNVLEELLKERVVASYRKNKSFELAGRPYDPSHIDKKTVFESDVRYQKLILPDGKTPFGHSVEYIVKAFTTGKVKGIHICTDRFFDSPPKEKREKTANHDNRKVATDEVFIVHGTDHKPVKELKTILEELGLKPIVLHEQASGGLTLAEKLERYAGKVGFAFVILTPDDVGGQKADLRKKLGGDLPFRKRTLAFAGLHVVDYILDNFESRARQNVIFEMGYFWGMLERKRVCCLLKGNVERPSDMHGIVYIPFKDSVNDVKGMIVKELAEAGYNVGSRKEKAKKDPKPATDISIVKTPSLFDHDKLIEVYSPIHAMIVRVNREIPRGFGLIGSWVKASLIDFNSISALFNQHNDKLRNRDLEMWLEIEKEIKAGNGFYLNEDRQAWFDELEAKYNQLTKHRRSSEKTV